MVVDFDVVFDGLNELGDAVEDTPSNLLIGQLGEPALDQVEP